MTNYKLYYFKARGRTESIRLLFTILGVSFEDIRYSDEEWEKHRHEMPLGLMPVLEVDGKRFSSSTAILRYIANEYGLAGKDKFERAVVDQFGTHIYDISNSPGVKGWWLVTHDMHEDPQYKGEEGKKLYVRTKVAEDIEEFTPVLEKYISQNPHGVLVGDSFTWADILLAEQFAKFLDFGDPHSLDKYPHVKALVKKVHDHPRIAKYIATRPATLD